MSYAFRKIYADLVAPDGSVCVTYLTWIRFWRRWYASAGVELYHPEGSRELHHAAGAPAPVDQDTPRAELPLALELPDGAFELVHELVHGGWTPSVPAPDGALRWSVKLARGNAVARFSDGRPDLHGTGYVDFVELVRPTRWLGFDKLCWGRLHLPGRTVVADELTRVDGTAWRPGASWPGCEAKSRFEIEDGSGSVRVGGQRYELSPRRVLHAGDAFDPRRIPSVTDRTVCQLVGGPHFETRWFGEVHSEDGERGWGLWEQVHFGRGATERLRGQRRYPSAPSARDVASSNPAS